MKGNSVPLRRAYLWTTVDDPTDLILTIQYKGQVQELKRLKVTESSEMSGIWMSLDQNQKNMLQHLQSETLKWASQSRSGKPIINSRLDSTTQNNISKDEIQYASKHKGKMIEQ